MYYIQNNISEFEKEHQIQGDFATTLWEGYASKKIKNVLEPMMSIERLGPSVPEAYISMNDLIVTDSFKEKLCQSELIGFTPIFAKKEKIVACDWMNIYGYDFFENYYSIYDVIDKSPHDQTAADKMPNLWWIKPNFDLPFTKIGKNEWTFLVTEESDFFNASNDLRGLYVSNKAKIWLSETYQYFNFIKTTSPYTPD